MTSTTVRFIGAVKWNAATSIASLLSQTLIMASLARLLTPADFGEFAIANIAFILAINVGQIGIVAAIMREPVLEKEVVGSAIALSLAVSILFASATFVSAPWIARVGATADLAVIANLIRLNSVAIFVYGITNPAIAMLSRELRYRELGLIQLGALMAGSGLLSNILAVANAGVWSLALGSLLNNFCVCIACWWLLRAEIAFSISKEHVSRIGWLGLKMGVMHGADLLWKQTPIIFAYIHLSATDIGVYQRSQVLVDTGVQSTVQNVSTTFFAAAVSVRDRTMFLQKSVPPLVGLYAAFLIPASVFVANMAPEIVLVLLGKQWTSAPPVLVFLMYGFCILIVSQPVSCALEVLAQVKPRLLATCAGIIVLIILCILFGREYGLLGIASATVISSVVTSLLNFIAGVSILGIRPSRIAQWTIPAIFMSAIMEAGILSMRIIEFDSIRSPGIKLTIALAVAFVLFVAGFRSSVRGLKREELSRYLSSGRASRTVRLAAWTLGLK